MACLHFNPHHLKYLEPDHPESPLLYGAILPITLIDAPISQATYSEIFCRMIKIQYPPSMKPVLTEGLPYHAQLTRTNACQRAFP